MDEKIATYLTKIVNEQVRQGEVQVQQGEVLAHQGQVQAHQGEVQAQHADLLRVLVAEQAKQGQVQAKQGDVQAKQAADIAEIKDLLKAMYPLLIASNARNDEQSKRIDDLSRIVATMVPQRLAAVGER